MSLHMFFFYLQVVVLVAQILCGVILIRTGSDRWAFPAIFLGPVNVFLCGLVLATSP